MKPPHFLLLVLLTSPVQAGGIYWSNRGAGLLERSSYDGTGKTTVLASAGTNVRGIALDLISDKIYYADNGADILYKLNLNGTGRTTVLSLGMGTSFPADVRLNLAAGHLYYCDQQKTYIRRINLDGSNPVTLVTDTTYQPYYLDLDLAGGKIYWGDFDGTAADTGNVFRMNLDGSNRETIVTGNLETRAVCVDTAGGVLYWVNRNAGKIMRCALSALPVNAATSPAAQTLYSNLDTPHGMVLDVRAGKVYWVDTGSNNVGGIGARAVSRGDMDGRGAQEVIVDLNSDAWDIDIDPRCLSYAEWTARYFPRNSDPIGHPDPNAAATADPDKDGVINAVEFATGMHPLRSDAPGLPVSVIHTEGGIKFPAIRYVRRTGATGLATHPQHSTDFVYWWDETSPTDGIPRLTDVSVTPLPEGLELVTVRSIFSFQEFPRQFLRLRVEVTP